MNEQLQAKYRCPELGSVQIRCPPATHNRGSIANTLYLSIAVRKLYTEHDNTMSTFHFYKTIVDQNSHLHCIVERMGSTMIDIAQQF